MRLAMSAVVPHDSSSFTLRHRLQLHEKLKNGVAILPKPDSQLCIRIQEQNEIALLGHRILQHCRSQTSPRVSSPQRYHIDPSSSAPSAAVTMLVWAG